MTNYGYIMKMTPEQMARFLESESWVQSACDEHCLRPGQFSSGCRACYHKWLREEYKGEPMNRNPYVEDE